MGGAARSAERPPWGLTVLVMWMLVALCKREGGPVGARRLCADLKANFGSADELPRAWAALEVLEAKGMLEVAGEREDPLLSLTPCGVGVLEIEDAKVVGKARKLGIRGPYPGARLIALAYLEWVRAEGPRPTVH